MIYGAGLPTWWCVCMWKRERDFPYACTYTSCPNSPGIYRAEKKHGFLKIGDVVDGYALVKQSPTCNTFKLDQPPKHKPRRTTKKRRSIRVKR